MLVLTRKSQQSIMIGEDIEVMVVSIDGNSVRIGINAPRDIKILRKETFEEVRMENLRAIEAAAKHTGDIDEILLSGQQSERSKEQQDD